jgi:hypothetical protein
MMLPTLSVIPSTMLSMTIGSLLGPVSVLAVGAVLVAMAVIMGGLLGERRDTIDARSFTTTLRATARRAPATIMPLSRDAA